MVVSVENSGKSLFLTLIGDSVRNRILEFFIEGRERDYPTKFVAEETGTNRATIYKVFDNLVEEKILTFSRKLGLSSFYRLNLTNESVKVLINLFDELVNQELKKNIIATQIRIEQAVFPAKSVAAYRRHYLPSKEHEMMNLSQKQMAVA